jgi:hypothetical protein
MVRQLPAFCPECEKLLTKEVKKKIEHAS